jgi:hypothetical protein
MKISSQVKQIHCDVTFANKRLHAERRHTLLFVWQALLPSGEAPAVMPPIAKRVNQNPPISIWLHQNQINY